MPDDATVSVRYLVDDVEAAVDFYTRHFDFTVLTSFAPVFADVQRGNLRLLLSGPQSSAACPMADGAQPVPGGWNRIHFIVEDLEKEIARLEARGGAVPQRRRRRSRRHPGARGRSRRQPRRAAPADRAEFGGHPRWPASRPGWPVGSGCSTRS